jgi:hypothetical protein
MKQHTNPVMTLAVGETEDAVVLVEVDRAGDPAIDTAELDRRLGAIDESLRDTARGIIRDVADGIRERRKKQRQPDNRQAGGGDAI